ncbi:MAG: TIGR03905 family TSCPD domain-containing protein [Bacillota bacterium]|nr:TIGR03905 family TSCPD domain-containing protein [Bacillota bacterium]
MYRYKTKGTCSMEIGFDVDQNKVKNIKFTGGCNGNLKGIAVLAEGRDMDELITKFKDIKCGDKDTSCPAQLARALLQYREEMTRAEKI